MSSARDSNRLATVSNLWKWLDLYSISVWNYPEPDNYWTALTGWTNSSIKQWEVWENIARLIKMSETPLDPLTKSKYTYSVFWDWKYYQIATDKENLTSSIINTTYADSQSAIVSWNYKMDPSLPSLIVVKDSVNTSSWIFDPNVCFVVNWWTNILNTSSWSCLKKKDMSLKDFDNSLVWYWDMETLSWWLLKDLSGNGNDWTANGGVNINWTWSKNWRWIYFDWVDDIIIVWSWWTLNINNEITIQVLIDHSSSQPQTSTTCKQVFWRWWMWDYYASYSVDWCAWWTPWGTKSAWQWLARYWTGQYNLYAVYTNNWDAKNDEYSLITIKKSLIWFSIYVNWINYTKNLTDNWVKVDVKTPTSKLIQSSLNTVNSIW
jgi:hypothetical protein